MWGQIPPKRLWAGKEKTPPLVKNLSFSLGLTTPWDLDLFGVIIRFGNLVNRRAS